MNWNESGRKRARAEEDNEEVGHNSWSPDRYSSLGLPIHEAIVVPIRQRHSVLA